MPNSKRHSQQEHAPEPSRANSKLPSNRIAKRHCVNLSDVDYIIPREPDSKRILQRSEYPTEVPQEAPEDIPLKNIFNEHIVQDFSDRPMKRTTVFATPSIDPRPRTVRLLPRGNWMDESGPLMHPALPDYLHPSTLEDPRRRASTSGTYPRSLILPIRLTMTPHVSKSSGPTKRPENTSPVNWPPKDILIQAYPPRVGQPLLR